MFSKSQLQEFIPGISKRQIDEARRHADLRGPGKPSSPPEIRRMRLEATKTDHFLDFISSSSLLQDVSYGTKSLKLDSGEKLRVRLQYDHKQATNAILLWKAYLLRTVTQEKAKQDILANLGKRSTLMIMDWAMKFQAMKFRERMDHFFGKLGRSWHVTCAIKREDHGRLEVDTFVHLFDSCVQDWFSQCCVNYRTHHFCDEDGRSTAHQSLPTL